MSCTSSTPFNAMPLVVEGIERTDVKEEIREKAAELGFDLCRITSADRPPGATHFEEWLGRNHHGDMAYLARNTHKRIDPAQVLGEARSIIALATSYYRLPRRGELVRARERNGLVVTHPSEEDRNAKGIIARYAQFEDYHDVLGERLKVLTKFVDQVGGAGARSLWYVDTGPLLERDLAQRAGLGFIGKHTNLISPDLGNWFFLSEIITTVALEPDQSERNKCGTCSRCMTACPTGAIIGPFQLDARRCISYLTIELKGSIPEDLRPAIGARIYGCDDCLTACPWNRFAREGAMMNEHARPDLAAPELVELLSLDDAGFKRRFTGTPILRAKRRGLLRNVCVALGNIGDARALPALQRAAHDVEPLVAEHARWAIEQIESRESVSQSRTGHG